ncbi:MAG: plasmid mobilization relaxosome protein MobC [Sarcina sp.]
MKKLTLRLNETDYNLLVEQCNILETNQNELLRELIRKNTIHDIKEYNELLKDFFRILKSTSNNLNQLARKSHYSDEVEEIRKELKSIWQSLKE